MYIALGFIVLVFVLSALRKRLVFELSAVSLLAFGNIKPGVAVYSVLVFPGTVLHELSHWLVAEILQVPTGDIVILPDLETIGKESRLGYVQTGKTDPLRGFLIGIAPFVSGMGVLLILGLLISRFLSAGAPWWQILLVGYGIMVVSNSLLLSSADRRYWPIVLVLMVLISWAGWKTGLVIPASFIESASGLFLNLDKVLGVTVGINLAMILGSYLLRRGVERFTHQRIGRK